MTISMIAAIGLLGSAGAQPTSAFVAQARAACAAPIGREPRLRGIDVTAAPAAAQDLPRLRVTDTVSGGWTYVYHDAASAAAARARTSCLGAQLRLLHARLGALPAGGEWASVVFTSRADYVAPAGAGVTRWRVPVTADGALDAAAQNMIVGTIPHEQVHRFQSRAGGRLPRWVAEGQAEWVGRKVTAQIAPAAAAASDRRSAVALQTADAPAALAKWGTMQVRREAIMRQVSAEERRRMEADATYSPAVGSRSFRFEGDDIVSDESNTPHRYAASWQLFRDLEAAHGEARVRAWANALSARAGAAKADEATARARELLDEDLSARLR